MWHRSGGRTVAQQEATRAQQRRERRAVDKRSSTVFGSSFGSGGPRVFAVQRCGGDAARSAPAHAMISAWASAWASASAAHTPVRPKVDDAPSLVAGAIRIVTVLSRRAGRYVRWMNRQARDSPWRCHPSVAYLRVQCRVEALAVRLHDVDCGDARPTERCGERERSRSGRAWDRTDAPAPSVHTPPSKPDTAGELMPQ